MAESVTSLVRPSQWLLHMILIQIARFMGPTWGPPGSCRPQKGPILAPRTLLSGNGPVEKQSSHPTPWDNSEQCMRTHAVIRTGLRQFRAFNLITFGYWLVLFAIMMEQMWIVQQLSISSRAVVKFTDRLQGHHDLNQITITVIVTVTITVTVMHWWQEGHWAIN